MMRKSRRLTGAVLLLLATVGARRRRTLGRDIVSRPFGAGPCPAVAFSLSVDGVAIEGSAESQAAGGKIKWRVGGVRTHDFIQIEMGYRPALWSRKVRVQWTGFQRHGLMQLTSSRDEACRQPRSVNLRRID